MNQFSVVLATRNRPQLFARALSSVLAQTFENIQIIVVNDGSDEEHVACYDSAIDAADRPIQSWHLARRPNGHGQSYSINVGVSQANGEYVCFLDDDDVWTDQAYLARINTAILNSEASPELIFSNQTAYLGDQQKRGPIWLDDLASKLSRSGRSVQANGHLCVSVIDLLGSGGFCHLNTMVVRRSLYNSVNGMDEGLRWECDHDLFLRLIDKAKWMELSPMVVSRHNIPDPASASSMTTSLSDIQRRLYQLRVFDKACLFASHPAIRIHGRQQKGYVLKRIAETLAARQDYSSASFYACEALSVKPTLKWTIYTGTLLLRSLVGRQGAG